VFSGLIQWTITQNWRLLTELIISLNLVNLIITIEKFLKKKKQEFNESSSKQISEKLNREIQEVHKIMVENINLLMDREKNLDSIYRLILAISRISSSMKDDSKVFKKKAYEVRIKLLLSKYAPLIAIVAVILLVIVFKIYF
jgi:vesicle transport protein SEC22